MSSPLISWSSFGILLGFTLYGCLKPNEFGLHWDKQAFVPKFVCGIWYVLMGVHLLIGRIFSEARQNLLEKLSRCQLWPELGPAPFCPLPFRNLPVLHKAVLCTTKTGSVDVIPGPLRRWLSGHMCCYEVIRKSLKYPIWEAVMLLQKYARSAMWDAKLSKVLEFAIALRGICYCAYLGSFQ